MNKIRIGFIGLGNITQKIYLPRIRHHEGFIIQAFCDLDLMKAKAIAHEYGVPEVAKDAQELINSSSVDVVLVCTPNVSHASIVRMAIEADKNVICEKPLATRSIDARELIDTARQHERSLFVSFTNRFRPEIELLRSMIRAGELGDIYCIKAGWVRNRGVPGIGSWFTKRSLSGGGVLVDLGSHMLDLIFWLLPDSILNKVTVSGSVHNVFGFQNNVNAEWYASPLPSSEDESDVEDTAFAMLLIDDRIAATLEVSWATRGVLEDSTYIHLLGKKGSAKIRTLFGLSPHGSRSTSPLELYKVDVHGLTLPYIHGSENPYTSYYRQIDFFYQALSQEKPCIDMAEDSLRNIILIETIYKASANSSSINVDLSNGSLGKLQSTQNTQGGSYE